MQICVSISETSSFSSTNINGWPFTHCPIIIHPSEEACDQLEFFSSCAIITPHAPQLSKYELEFHLLSHWPSSPAWEVFEFVNGKFLIKFSSQSARDEALKSSGASLVALSASFAPWSVHSSLVFTLRDEGMWICMDGIPHYLWNVNLFHKMVIDFVVLLEVDLGIDQAMFQGYARVKIALHIGKSLLDVRYFAFARNVYPIRFCRSWDIYSSSSSS